MPLEELDRNIPNTLKLCQKAITDNSEGVSTPVQDKQDKTLQSEVGDINNESDLHETLSSTLRNATNSSDNQTYILSTYKYSLEQNVQEPAKLCQKAITEAVSLICSQQKHEPSVYI